MLESDQPGDRLMDRRRFLLTALASALAVPLDAEAQQVGRAARGCNYAPTKRRSGMSQTNATAT